MHVYPLEKNSQYRLIWIIDIIGCVVILISHKNVKIKRAIIVGVIQKKNNKPIELWFNSRQKDPLFDLASALIYFFIIHSTL